MGSTMRSLEQYVAAALQAGKQAHHESGLRIYGRTGFGRTEYVVETAKGARYTYATIAAAAKFAEAQVGR